MITNKKQKIIILRKQIDKIDAVLLGLLVKRFELAKRIGVIKKELSIPLTDKKRERNIMKRVKNTAAKFSISENFANNLFTNIIRQTKKYESKV